MNARNLGFPAGTFDIALTGFMGWYDCFDFQTDQFTIPDTKAPEIYRVLKDGGRVVCCSWEEQYDLAWMEDAVLRNYPQLLENPEYLQRRPIGMAYEKARGYQIILRQAGFRHIAITTHSLACLSTDEEEFWQQMQLVGWESLLAKLDAKVVRKLKAAIFRDLQDQKQGGGIIFEKKVFFVCGQKF
jgi:ubiquinone/menaquinone biosynthesis C-methylase UbiE